LHAREMPITARDNKTIFFIILVIYFSAKINFRDYGKW